MKNVSKKIISIILSLVLLMSVCSTAFVSFAETEKENFSAPDIQTMLTDGKALKAWLESSFLNLENADVALSENLDAIVASAAPMLTDLYYYMGYNEADYPSDLESLELCLARALSSLSDKMFREPEPIETIDISLLYNFAFIGGTDYIESVNASLPDELKFDTSKPVIELNDEQKASLSEYYAKWKAGALNLTGFNLKDYLGEMTAQEFFKDVLLVFIADDARLPSITKTALNFEFGYSEKCAAARAVADIVDNLKTAPVTAIIRQLSDESLQNVIKNLVEVANMLTVNTNSYSYRLFTEGIYTDTDGSAVPYIVKDGDTYRYAGPTMVSEYLATVDAALDLFKGIDKELDSSVLESVFDKRLDKLATLASAALDAAFATVASEQLRLQNEIDCANIEIRYANEKIQQLQSLQGNEQESLRLNNQLAQLNEEIADLQEQLESVENQILTAKADYQGYYELVEQVENGNLPADEDYQTAKQKVEEIEQELAPLYTQKENLTQTISQKVEQADVISRQLEELEETDYDQIAVWQEAKQYAQGVITESTEKLAALPDTSAIESVYNTLKPIVAGFFTAFDGVYDTMINETPVKAIIRLVYNLEDFIDAIENIDWNAIAPVTQPIFESIDSYIDSLAGNFIGKNGGANLLTMLSDYANSFLEQYGIENFVQTSYLDSFIKENILADNSPIMQAAANGLSQIFGSVSPTYESIVTCIIPFLSSFSFADLDLESLGSGMDMSGMFTLASPSAFAYLAGLSSTYLENGYFDRINAFLRENNYTGTAVAPIISLSSSASSGLLSYVSMEKNGSSLEQIAAAGFNWKNYVGSANPLDVANALVKIALGDANKLGDITTIEGVGPALVNLLCDLLNDIQSRPVSTILSKLSTPANLTPLANFAFSIFSREDSNYKSYDLYFNEKIFRDSEGNTTFYDAVVDGELIYTGPYSFGYYVPLVASVIDFLSGLSTKVEENDGDLLKTLLYNKLPQLKNVILSAISYKDSAGNDKAGAIFYLLLGYEDFERAQNELLCYELLVAINELNITNKLGEIEYQNERLDFLHQKLDELKPASEAKKFAKAKELGVIPADAVYSEGLIEQAIEDKTAELEQAIAQTQQDIDNAQAEIDRLSPLVEEKRAPFNEFDSWLYGFADDIYDSLTTIFESKDYSDLLDELRDNYADDYNAMVADPDVEGDNPFEDFIADIESKHGNYDPSDDIDDFVTAFEDDYLLYGGRTGDIDYALYTEYDSVNQEYEAANTALTTAQTQLKSQTAIYNNYANGTIVNAITAAGKQATIKVMNSDLEIFLGEVDEDAINEEIQNIEQQGIGAIESEIARMQADNEEYLAASELAAQKASGFNFTLIPLAAQAADAIAQGVIDFLAGSAADGSLNVYNYIKNKDVAGILTSEGRLQSLFEIIVGLYAPALDALVSQGMLSKETAEQLIAATPSFDSFYNTELAEFPEAFKVDPVPATAALINAFCTTILTGFATLDEMNKDTKQIKEIDADIADIFSKESGSEWYDSYSKSVITRTGEIYQLIIDLLGLSFIRDLVNDDPTHVHSYSDVVKAPTCTKQGYTLHTCSCGDSYKDTYVDALGHDFSDNAEFCRRGCGTANPDYVPPHVHDYKAVITAPTCTEQGYTTHTCSCGDSYKDTYVDALGHDFSDNAEYCRRGCGTANPDYVPPHVHDYKAVVTAPTCTEQGYTTYTCSCGDSYKGDYVNALGHDFSDNAEFCRRGCGTANPDYVPPHVHDYKAVVTAPTCTAQGYTTYTCSCGDSYKGDYVNALGHNMTFHDGAQATCTTAGNKPYNECGRCHNYYIDAQGENLIADKSEVVLPALGHDFSDNAEVCRHGCGTANPDYVPPHVHDYKAIVTAPKANAVGYTQYKCDCGEWKTDEAGKVVKDTFKAPTGKPSGLKCASRTATAQKFTWTKTAGVTGYQVQILNAKGGNAGLKALTGNSYTFTKLAAGHAYKARVRFFIKAADGKNYFGAWSALVSSPTLPAASAISKLTPAKKAFTAQWKKVAVTGYQLQYATNAKFTKATTKTIKGAAKVKLAIKTPKGGTRYYVRIRTYKTIGGKNYYSAWSRAKAVVTKK